MTDQANSRILTMEVIMNIIKNKDGTVSILSMSLDQVQDLSMCIWAAEHEGQARGDTLKIEKDLKELLPEDKRY